MVALHNTFFEISIESQDMSVKVNPVGLVELRCILTHVFGVVMVMRSGEEGRIVDNRFLVDWLSGQRILSWLDFINVSVLFLLLGTYFFVMLFEFLSWCEAGEEWEIGSHSFFITYFNIIF